MSIDFKNEKDEFWDLDKLVPKKKPSLRPFATAPVVRDYTVSDDSAPMPAYKTENDERKLTFSNMKGTSDTEDVTYYPENTLIKSITVKKFKETYDFYDSFRRAALLYFECVGA